MNATESTMTQAPSLSDQERLILRVGLPRLADHLDGLAQWLDQAETLTQVSAANEIAALAGSESLPVLLQHPPDERSELLRQAKLPDPVREEFTTLLDRFGTPSDPNSPAAKIARMFPDMSRVRRPTPDSLSQGVAVLLDLVSKDQKEQRSPSARATLLEALQLISDAGDESQVAMIQQGLAEIDWAGGNHRSAAEHLQQALMIQERLGNEYEVARICLNLGNCVYVLADRPTAEALYRKGLALCERLGDVLTQAGIVHQLGVLAQERGDLDESERFYRQSLALRERIGMDEGQAATLHQLGNLAYLRGDLAEAERLYRTSLSLHTQFGDESGRAGTMSQLGMLAQQRGDQAYAERMYLESLAIRKQMVDVSGQANSFHQLGSLAETQQDFHAAEMRYQEALDIFAKLKDEKGIARTYGSLGRLALRRGEILQSWEWLLRALGGFAGIGERELAEVTIRLLQTSYLAATPDVRTQLRELGRQAGLSDEILSHLESLPEQQL